VFYFKKIKLIFLYIDIKKYILIHLKNIYGKEAMHGGYIR
jgi:hypothetical protein